jgi:small GTP-binding protein
MHPVKVVVIGDGAVGKTSLLISYTTNTFPVEYTPTIFDNYSACLMVDKTAVSLGLWDTAGQEEYDRLRQLSYPQTDVFLACYSVVSPTSCTNIREKWIPEIRHYCPDKPVVLVGLKTDLRYNLGAIARLSEQNMSPVSEEQGNLLAKQIGAKAFFECSSLTNYNVTDCFTAAVRIVLSRPKQKSKKFKKICTLL